MAYLKYEWLPDVVMIGFAFVIGLLFEIVILLRRIAERAEMRKNRD